MRNYLDTNIYLYCKKLIHYCSTRKKKYIRNKFIFGHGGTILGKELDHGGSMFLRCMLDHGGTISGKELYHAGSMFLCMLDQGGSI